MLLICNLKTPYGDINRSRHLIQEEKLSRPQNGLLYLYSPFSIYVVDAFVKNIAQIKNV
jgi:hypothetical protein